MIGNSKKQLTFTDNLIDNIDQSRFYFLHWWYLILLKDDYEEDAEDKKETDSEENEEKDEIEDEEIEEEVKTPKAPKPKATKVKKETLSCLYICVSYGIWYGCYIEWYISIQHGLVITEFWGTCLMILCVNQAPRERDHAETSIFL